MQSLTILCLILSVQAKSPEKIAIDKVMDLEPMQSYELFASEMGSTALLKVDRRYNVFADGKLSPLNTLSLTGVYDFGPEGTVLSMRDIATETKNDKVGDRQERESQFLMSPLQHFRARIGDFFVTSRAVVSLFYGDAFLFGEDTALAATLKQGKGFRHLIVAVRGRGTTRLLSIEQVRDKYDRYKIMKLKDSVQINVATEQVTGIASVASGFLVSTGSNLSGLNSLYRVADDGTTTLIKKAIFRPQREGDDQVYDRPNCLVSYGGGHEFLWATQEALLHGKIDSPPSAAAKQASQIR